MHVFCPHTGCGCKASYDAVKPTTCPRCNRAFAAAFKAPSAPTPIARAAVVDDPDDRPLTRSALTARQRAGITTQVKPRRGRGADPEAMANVMNAPEVLPDDLPAALEGDVEDETVNPREVRRLARELAAGIDPSTIIVADQDEGVFRFADMVAEAKANGGKQPGTTKPRRRR